MVINKAVVIVFFSAILFSCNNSVFEEKKDFKNEYWLWKEPISFSFTIDDADQKYDLSFFVRNSIDYEFQNLYIQYYLEDSIGNILTDKLHNIIVFDPKTGKPLGNGVGDIYNIEKTFLPGFKFAKAGEYRLRLDQYMRRDTLKNIQAIGFKIVESIEQD